MGLYQVVKVIEGAEGSAGSGTAVGAGVEGSNKEHALVGRIDNESGFAIHEVARVELLPMVEIST